MLSPNIVSFIAAELILAGARLKFAPGSAIRVVNAGIGDVEIGTAILHSGKDAYAAESSVGVKLSADPGTRTCIAAGPIVAGATVKRAAAGKVDDGGAGSECGIAMEAAGADGDTLECLFNVTPPISVVLTSTNGTMAAAADDAAVKVEGEKQGDDIRAIHAALVAKGILSAT
ncbi:MAG: hypothetical protein QOE70_5910 [Chthoniobacter sp.]|jgi:hypothetical protein|nr:hypothetical protein [Chthoniobacter sp.]